MQRLFFFLTYFSLSFRILKVGIFNKQFTIVMCIVSFFLNANKDLIVYFAAKTVVIFLEEKSWPSRM